jgi:Tfp pilus assembly protein PilO
MSFISNPIIRLSIYIILVIVFTVSSVLFLADKIESKTKKLQEKRSVLRVSQQQDENFLELKKTYDIIKNNQKKIEEIFPDDDNIGNFIIALENTAEQTSNAQILNFDSLDNAKAEGENIKSLKFTVFLTGNTNTFINYLKQIKSLPYFIEIENVTLNNNSSIANNDSRMDIKSKIYIRN